MINLEPQDQFRRGDKVKVTDGPFKELEATFDSMDFYGTKARVLIELFGHTTPVSVPLDNIARLA
jgi:transcription antitermination factor NusG